MRCRCWVCRRQERARGEVGEVVLVLLVLVGLTLYGLAFGRGG